MGRGGEREKGKGRETIRRAVREGKIVKKLRMGKLERRGQENSSWKRG